VSKIFITSDLHFGHDRGFLYEPRGFSNIESHDETVIQNWNSVVEPEDEVYILGDLMLNDNSHGIE
jgi:calcineurin-like phosphoesterase family protein